MTFSSQESMHSLFPELLASYSSVPSVCPSVSRTRFLDRLRLLAFYWAEINLREQSLERWGQEWRDVKPESEIER